MTVPLLALGGLTLIGGLINLPTWVGGHHWLESWLLPVTASAHFYMRPELPHGTTEYVLIGIATVVAIGGLVAGYRSTLAQAIAPARDAPEEKGIWRVLYHKYYVDEFYDAIVVRPLRVKSSSSGRSPVVPGFSIEGGAL